MDISKPICPRCAYDLSGIVESWKNACPLAGTCSECGLTYTWRDVISGPLRLPRWSFEHATPNRLVPTFFATLWRILFPTRLWRSIRLEMRIEPRRLMALVIFGALAWRCLGAAVLGTPAYLVGQMQMVTRYYQTSDLVTDLAWPYTDIGNWWRRDGQIVSPWLLISVLTVLATPLAFYLLPVSLRRAKVSARHIARVQCYSLASLPWTIGMWTIVGTALFFAWAFDIDIPYFSRWVYDQTINIPIGLATLLWTIGVLVRFWGAAVRHYLRLDHARAVAAAMVCVAGLVSALLVTVAAGPGLFL